MAANLLHHPQRDARVAHLSQSRSPKTVGGCALDAGAYERFSQNRVR